jgi:hypothetical protein
MFLVNTTKDTLVLILDIQSSTVSGALVMPTTDGAQKIIFSHSVNIIGESKSDNARLIKSTLKAVRENTQAVNSYLHGQNFALKFPQVSKKISEVHYVLASPWIVSEAKVLSLKFEKDNEISKKYICDLIEKDRAAITSEISEPFRVIEQKIFDVRLNGYSVTVWENKKARALDVSFTISVAGTKMIQYFTDECTNMVSPHKIQFHSSLLLQYIGIENVLKHGPDYCLAHIHGDLTDVFIVKQNSCVFFGSFRFGIRTLINKIAKITNNHREAVDSLLTLYAGGKLDEAHNAKNIEVIDNMIGEWKNEFNKLLTESKIDFDHSLPIILNTISHEDCFVKVLKKLDPSVDITLLSTSDLLAHVIFGEQTQKGKLAALYAIAIHSLSV